MDWCISHTGILNNQPSCSLQQPAIMFIVVSSFLVLAIYVQVCVLCNHYAGGTCILHCALFNIYYTRPVTITPVPPPQAPQKAPRFPSTVLHHSLLALWQLSKWHFTDFMERISQTRNETYFHCLHYTTLCFRKRRWRKLWNQSKIPLNTLKDQMNLNRFIILQKK